KEDFSHVALNSTMRKTKNCRLTSSIKILLDKIHEQPDKYNSFFREKVWTRNGNCLLYKNRYAIVLYKTDQLRECEFKKRVEEIQKSIEKEIKAKGLYENPIAIRTS